MSTKIPETRLAKIPAGARIAIVAARFNGQIVDELLKGCIERLERLGVGESRVRVHRVPGAFELPVAAKMLARTGKFSAIICLGAVIRGDTDHYHYVCEQVSYGCQKVMLNYNIPVIFGVLTVNTEEEALARIGGSHGHKGKEAAQAAIQMVALARAFY